MTSTAGNDEEDTIGKEERYQFTVERRMDKTHEGFRLYTTTSTALMDHHGIDPATYVEVIVEQPQQRGTHKVTVSYKGRPASHLARTGGTWIKPCEIGATIVVTAEPFD